MRKILGAVFACLTLVAVDAAEAPAGFAAAAERLAEATPPSDGPAAPPHRSGLRHDRHAHDRRRGLPDEGPAVLPPLPDPIPSPHYDWRG